ncbi:conserved hypothetical protein [Ricinus communis]|uniref:DNA binding protein n=1 Tax=Ricinus communis TaxID=3988 RepID=B9SPQ8_RICCO|nr:conserved hypothetical protein [Ricinus communis]|eukprot:XP_002527977.1 uncharacterized protein LOC8282077 [Ricinus communis]
MLTKNLVSGRVEAALPFASNHGNEDNLLCDWVIRSQHEPGSNGICKRRKLQEKYVAVEDETPIDTLRSGLVKTNSDHTVDESGSGVPAPTVSVQKHKEVISSIDESARSHLPSASLDKKVTLNLQERVGNSELVVLGEHFSERDLCISVLTSHGLLVGDCPISSGAPAEVAGISKDRTIFQYCDLCGILDDTLNMLLCDHCEGAFHVSCCNSKTKMLPIDDWFCQFCANLHDRVSLEASFLRSQKISWGNGLAYFKSGRIASMLKYPDTYTSRVRVGDSFQAAVPQWSDQTSKDFDCIGEPLKMDPSETMGLHGSSIDKHLKLNSLSNWLQCQEVLYDETGEPIEGTKCRKWRRAPLSEVQTDEWDCSCSVTWDPFHSDCAVPQELETGEVLRQLKYINQLRSRQAVNKLNS